MDNSKNGRIATNQQVELCIAQSIKEMEETQLNTHTTNQEMLSIVESKTRKALECIESSKALLKEIEEDLFSKAKRILNNVEEHVKKSKTRKWHLEKLCYLIAYGISASCIFFPHLNHANAVASVLQVLFVLVATGTSSLELCTYAKFISQIEDLKPLLRVQRDDKADVAIMKKRTNELVKEYKEMAVSSILSNITFFIFMFFASMILIHFRSLSEDDIRTLISTLLYSTVMNVCSLWLFSTMKFDVFSEK